MYFIIFIYLGKSIANKQNVPIAMPITPPRPTQLPSTPKTPPTHPSSPLQLQNTTKNATQGKANDINPKKNKKIQTQKPHIQTKPLLQPSIALPSISIPDLLDPLP